MGRVRKKSNYQYPSLHTTKVYHNPLLKVLELGGGNGEHLSYVSHGFDSYTQLDLREAVLEDRHQKDPRINSVIADAEHHPIDDL